MARTVPRAPRSAQSKLNDAAAWRARWAALDPQARREHGRKRRAGAEHAAVQRRSLARCRARKRRDLIVLSNREMVIDLAQQIGRHLPLQFDSEDLVSVGNLELVEKAATYTPKAHKAIPFALYARQAIHGKMVDSVRRNKYVEQMRQSIDDPGPERDGHEGRRLTEAQCGLLRMATQPVAEEALDRDRLSRRLSAAIDSLPAAERDLMRLWYSPGEPRTYEVARALDLSCREAKALHASAIGRLKEILL
jgi:RNA polymerase sigma factor (sigma-70 family)